MDALFSALGAWPHLTSKRIILIEESLYYMIDIKFEGDIRGEGLEE
jgi:hypothetical protein